jgi:hypothetical protein
LPGYAGLIWLTGVSQVRTRYRKKCEVRVRQIMEHFLDNGVQIGDSPVNEWSA